MRAIVQRCKAASVSVDNELISQISRGFLVLVGISRDDSAADVESLAKKILALRAFSDPETGMPGKATVKDVAGEILCVSQFTLYANASKGRPDFHLSMPTEPGREMYASFLGRLRAMYGMPDRIKDGRFGAMMDVTLTNEGPVTFTLESKKPGGHADGNAAVKNRSGTKILTAAQGMPPQALGQSSTTETVDKPTGDAE